MPSLNTSSFYSTLLHCLQSNANRPLVYWQGQWINNKQILYKSLRLAKKLQAFGFTKNSVIGVYIERSPDVLVALLAIWHCELTYLPIDPSWPQARINKVIDTADITCILTQAQFAEISSGFACSILCLNPMQYSNDEAPCNNDALIQDSNNLHGSNNQDDSIAYILFTSGSSGHPKGVCITHKNLATLMQSILPLLNIQPGWKILGNTNFSFDICFFELLAPILTSSKLVLVAQGECGKADCLLALIREMNIELVQATPSLWSLILGNNTKQKLNIKLAISTGEALDIKTARQLIQHSEIAWNLYGPTECTIWASACQLNAANLENEQVFAPIGKALSGYELNLLNSNTGNKQLTGELLIASNAVSKGYCSEQAGANKAFSLQSNGTRAYKTGDLCSQDQYGNFHFITRIDNQVKVNGYRIETDEISILLKQHSSIKNAACIAKKLGVSKGSQILAFVVFDSAMPNKDKLSLNNYLSKHLPKWMLPDKYLVFNELPLTQNGKLDTNALLQASNNFVGCKLDSSMTTTQPIEASLASIFCEILEINAIGTYDNFFDVGGNSMLSAVLVMAVNNHFGSSITLQQALSTPPTVASFCQLIQGCPLATRNTNIQKTA